MLYGRSIAMFVLVFNPKSYENKGCVNNAEKMTQTNFNYVTSGIRQAVTGQNDMCSGQLNKAFLTSLTSNLFSIKSSIFWLPDSIPKVKETHP